MDNVTNDMLENSPNNTTNFLDQAIENYNLAQIYAKTDLEGCLNKARMATEFICRHLIVTHKLEGWQNPQLKLDKMLHPLGSRHDIMPVIYHKHATTLQTWGNFGSHAQDPLPNGTLTYEDILPAMQALKCLMNWITQGNDSATIKPSANANSLRRSLTVNKDFFSCLETNPKKILKVSMALHVGSEWFTDSYKQTLLDIIKTKEIPLWVLLDKSKAGRKICGNMNRQQYSEYIKKWQDLANAHQNIHVQISDRPMLHRIYAILYDDYHGAVNIKYHTYGNNNPAVDYRASFEFPSAEYTLYTSEFEHLWKKAQK